MLESEHPELAEKAKKYLGYELYYSLTQNVKNVDRNSPEYKKLLAMSDELDQWYKKEIEGNMPHSKLEERIK